MATNKDNECSMKCACPMGWLNKRVLGLTLGVWLLVFAVLPMSARGMAWSVRSVAGLWDNGAKVVGFDGPARGDRRNSTVLLEVIEKIVENEPTRWTNAN